MLITASREEEVEVEEVSFDVKDIRVSQNSKKDPKTDSNSSNNKEN